MDFDDLDDAVDQRIAEGEEVVGHIKMNNQIAPGRILPLMERNRKLPPDKMLPEVAQKLLSPHPCEMKPKLRLLCIYGAGDACTSGWAAMAHEVDTPDIEVATYEWPGHGVRERSKLLNTLEDLRNDAFEALKPAMDTGSFAILGHSIGCLIATGVCERAKRELGVEPLYVIMLERGAPQFPVLSETGQKILRNDIDTFLGMYGVGFVSNLGGQHGKDMWQNDMELENDNRDPSYHTFSCPILSVCALRNYYHAENPDKQSEAEKAFADNRCKHISYFGTSYNFSKDMYVAWGEWTSHPDGCTVLYVDSDHYGVKTDKTVRTAMWKALKDVINTM